MIPVITVRPLVAADRDDVVHEMRAWSPNLDLDILLPPSVFAQADLSLLATDSEGIIVGFVLALRSHSHPRTGYVHFVWVSPDHRGQGLATMLYARLYDKFRAADCTRVEAVTSPRNVTALEFHRHLGFRLRAVPPIVDPGPDHAGPNREVVEMTVDL